MTGRLASAGLHVTLIEAGASDRHLKSRVPALTSSIVQNPDFDWCFQAEPDETIGGRADIWPAGKLLGSGSALNGMMFIRGHQWDYDHWAELGATGWNYQSVLPFFRRLEDNERGSDEWRGKGGPISVSEGRARYPITDAWIAAAEETGIERRDLNGERPRASITCRCHSAMASAARPRAVTCIISKAQTRLRFCCRRTCCAS